MNIADLIPPISNNQKKYKVHFAIGPSDKKEPLYEFINNEFKEWQEYQTKKNFEREFILSLIYFRKNEWLFAGVYKRINIVTVEDHFEYETELLDIGTNLIGRLIIKYQKEFRASYVLFDKYSTDFKLSEILKEKFSIKPFPGYENVIIDYNYLKTIIEKNDNSWESALKSVKGIYLIADKLTGKHYVGSAYGEFALWHRWTEYARNGHGGNLELKRLLDIEGSDYKQNFQYSILEIMSKTISDVEIIAHESLWKKKILSRKFGLNNN